MSDVIWACPKCAWAPWEFNTQVKFCTYCADEPVLTPLVPASSLEALKAENERLREALKASNRAIEVHTFSPSGHDTAEERDRCKVCGENFRSEKHLMVHEGHVCDVKAQALRDGRAALSTGGE